ncbi:CNP1-like family protein [Thiorhodococcus minor]|nr:CNP1-like family protein [Thiorhodococcus minor]
MAARDDAFVPDPTPPGPSDIRPGTPWQEAAVRLPPWPDDADLVEFELDGSADPFRYFIDAKHLSVGPDRVVRYTLVAQGRNGTRNLSFEGIRCSPKGSYKVFAYGTGGRFSALEGGDWQQISNLDGERYRKDLWRFHFCVPREFKPRPKQDMIRSLQGRIAPRQNTGFQAD